MCPRGTIGVEALRRTRTNTRAHDSQYPQRRISFSVQYRRSRSQNTSLTVAGRRDLNSHTIQESGPKSVADEIR